MSIKELAKGIKSAVDNRIKEEARAKRGTVIDGRFYSGAKSYPFRQVVDCNINGKVWAQISPNGTAVIVGAS